ncbi:MAG: hypothetical protein E6767_02105 [Dysgonomonas sp.]|nr:hypothetical protein [Dysgonomonas sp.]
MKSILRIRLSLFILISFSFISSYGQDIVPQFSDSIRSYFIQQLVMFPQEKVYVQNDKPYYIGGENVWFRVHLVDAQSHMPNSLSRYVYCELINPMNELIKRIKIRPVKGAHYGYFPIPEDLPEGDYQLRFYTRLMSFSDKDYFFKKKISIGNPLSVLYRTEANFTYDEKNKVSAELHFSDMKSGEAIKPENVRVGIEQLKKNKTSLSPDGALRLNLRTKDLNKYKSLYVEYTYKDQIHRQYLSIPLSQDNYDVSFFPEGGHLLADTDMRIAFKALNENGLGESVQGFVVNQIGDTITGFTSNDLGMGIFGFNAKSGDEYSVVCKNKGGVEKRFSLPLAVNKGVGLQTGMTKNGLSIKVQNTPNISNLEGMNIIVQSRGVPIYADKWNSKIGLITISKDLLPSGVIQILLTDQDRLPLSERLVFNFNPKDIANVVFLPDKPQYKKREKVKLDIDLSDNEGKPLEGNFSISVTDDRDVKTDSTVNILSTLLLTSELKGHIENPTYYLIKDNNMVSPEIDFLMMTQGWSRYNVNSIVRGKPERNEGYVEIGPYMSGKVKGGFFYNKGQSECNVTLTSFSPLMASSTQTDESGKFEFLDCEAPDSTTFFIRAYTKKGKSSIELEMDKDTFPTINYVLPGHYKDNRMGFDSFLEKAEQKFVAENGIRMIYLKEVVVTKNRQVKGKSSMSNYFNEVTSLEEIKEFAKEYEKLGDIFLDGKIKNVTVMSETEYLVNTDSAYIYLDAIMVKPEEMWRFNNLSPHDIEEIEITKSPVQITFDVEDTTNFGKFVQGEMLIVTTKSGTGLRQVKSHTNGESFRPLGYQITKHFYSPSYETKGQLDRVNADLRTTIYWNPDVQVSKKGKAKVEFYTADAPTEYSVVIEGVTKDGKLIYKKEKILRGD